MKKSEFKAYIREEIISVLSEEEGTVSTDDPKKAAELAKKGVDVQLSEEDEEPTDAELKKGDSVTKIANKLGETTKQMKSLVKKYKDAEEPEKSKLLARLKELTKIKKELEGLL